MDALEGYFIFDELVGVYKQYNLFPYSPCEDYPLVLGSHQIFQQALKESRNEPIDHSGSESTNTDI